MKTGRMTAEQLIEKLALAPLPGEGGYYRETYRSASRVTEDGKHHGTAIYFLITPGQFSSLHRLPTDEVWHFYLGDPVEQWRLTDEGSSEVVILGQDILATPAQQCQTVVPAHTWQGTRLVPGGAFALLGTTMAPGFDFDDLELANIEELLRHHPQHAQCINDFS